MVWDEETIRLLRDLWAQGHSTAEIGRRLGVSKNAIVGKAHRLELDARPSPIKRDVVKRRLSVHYSASGRLDQLSRRCPVRTFKRFPLRPRHQI